MSNEADSDIDELFAGFAEINPDADASSQAVESARRALLAQADQTLSVPQPWWRTQMMTRSFAASAFALLVLAVVFSAMFLTDGSSAFAQLQERLRKVHAITFESKLEAAGRPVETVTQHIRDDGSFRADYADGRYRIVKRTRNAITRLDVDTTNQTARLTHGFAGGETEDVIDMIVNMPQSDVAAPLGARQIDGKSCPGFLVKQKLGKDGSQEIRVWIDPDTKLPVYSQHIAERKTNRPATQPSRLIASSSNFQYDVALQDALFDLTPPDGYAVTSVGTPARNRSAPMPVEKLLLTVGEGIGQAKFGMSREEVLELLGEPVEKSKVTPKVREGTPQPELEIWNYAGEGFRLTFSSFDDPKFRTVCCRDSYNDVTADFRGKTKEGIGLGSSTDDVQRAYGKPDRNSVKDGMGGFEYRDKRMLIGFVEGKLHQIQFTRPAKKQ